MNLILRWRIKLHILLLGKNGQVGWELQRTLMPLGHVIALGRNELDLCNIGATRDIIKRIKPELIINAAAYNAVDQAEKEPEIAMAVNGIAPAVLAEEAKKLGASIIHYSTDYVFDGVQESDYSEDDSPNPINIYGKTKLEGENAIRNMGIPYFIIRTSWVYGLRRDNFLLTMLGLANKKEEIDVVADQYGSPTWCRFLAEATALLIRSEAIQEKQGIYNLSSEGRTSWYKFTKWIYKLAAVDIKVNPILSEQYPAIAARPKNSNLSNANIKQTFGIEVPHWKECLALVLEGDYLNFNL